MPATGSRPGSAIVMVSRQETARPLLTPGEVMQLPPDDELVLVSGVPPIRAKKLRYYEDRQLHGAAAAAAGARRWPPTRIGRRRGPTTGAASRGDVDARLGARPSSADADADEGGLQQQRTPELAEDTAARSPAARRIDPLGLDKDDVDPAADKRAMDRAAAAGPSRARPCRQRGRRATTTLPSF